MVYGDNQLGRDAGYTRGGQPVPFTVEGRNQALSGNYHSAREFQNGGGYSVHDNRYQLEDYFGPNLKQRDPNPYHAYPLEVSDLREAYYDGSNETMRRLMITNITTAELWPLEICPWKKHESSMEIAWDTHTFEDALMRPTPEEAPADLLVSTRSSRRVGVVRKAKAFQMEVGFQNTARGKTTYDMNMKQMTNAVTETACFDIVYQICTCMPEKDPYEHFRQQYPDSNWVEKLLQKECANWAIIQKDAMGLKTLVSQMQSEANVRGVGRLDTGIIPSGVRAYLDAQPDKFYMTGPGAVSKIPGGIRWHESRSFRIGSGEANLDPIETDQTIGAFFYMNDEHLRDVPTEEYKTCMRAYDYYCEEGDKMRRIQYLDAFAESGLYSLDNPSLPITDIGRQFMKTRASWKDVYESNDRLEALVNNLKKAPDSVRKDFVRQFGNDRFNEQAVSKAAMQNIKATRSHTLRPMNSNRGVQRDADGRVIQQFNSDGTETVLKRSLNNNNNNNDNNGCTFGSSIESDSIRDSRRKLNNGSARFDNQVNNVVNLDAFKNLNSSSSTLVKKATWLSSEIESFMKTIETTVLAKGCEASITNAKSSSTEVFRELMYKSDASEETFGFIKNHYSAALNTIKGVLSSSLPDGSSDAKELIENTYRQASGLVLQGYAKKDELVTIELHGVGQLACQFGTSQIDHLLSNASAAIHLSTKTNACVYIKSSALESNIEIIGTDTAAMWKIITSIVPESNVSLRARLLYNYYVLRLRAEQVDPLSALNLPDPIMNRMVELNKHSLNTYIYNADIPMFCVERTAHAKAATSLAFQNSYLSDKERQAYIKSCKKSIESTATTTLRPVNSFNDDFNTYRRLNEEKANGASKIADKLIGSMRKEITKKNIVTECFNTCQTFLNSFVSILVTNGTTEHSLKQVIAVINAVYNLDFSREELVPLFSNVDAVNFFCKLIYNQLVDIASFESGASGEQVAARLRYDIFALYFTTMKQLDKPSTDLDYVSVIENVPDTSFDADQRSLELDTIFASIAEAKQDAATRFSDAYLSYSNDVGPISRAQAMAVFVHSKIISEDISDVQNLNQTAFAMYQAFTSNTNSDIVLRNALKVDLDPATNQLPADENARLLVQLIYELLYRMKQQDTGNYTISAAAVVKNILESTYLKSNKDQIPVYVREVVKQLQSRNGMPTWYVKPSNAAAAAAAVVVKPQAMIEETSQARPQLYLKRRRIISMLSNISVLTGKFLIWAIENNLILPINLLFFRPHCRWKMAQIILLQSHGKVGLMIYGHTNFMMTTNIAIGIYTGQFTMYSKCVIFDPTIVVRQANAYCVRYLGGMGHRAFRPYNSQDRIDYSRGKLLRDFFVCAVDAKWKCDSWYLDITGELNSDLRGDHDVDDRIRYPTCDIYSAYWGWSNARNPLDPFKNEASIPQLNTLCLEDYHAIYDHSTKGWTNHRMSSGHWGEFIYTGRGKVTQHNLSLFRYPNWSQSSGISLA